MRETRSTVAITALLLCACACACAGLQAAEPLEGRWEGRIEVPGAPQPLVIDLAPLEGGWLGSAILPGRGVKGAALGDLRVTADGVDATLGAALPGPVDPPPALGLRLDAGGALRGELQLSGLAAPVVLQRSGAAQVDRAPASTPVVAALAGEWRGGYEFLGYPRSVSLRLEGTRAQMRIVGRRTTDIDFTRVRQRGSFLSLSGNPYDIGFEGLWDADKGLIDGSFLQGPIELPLCLERAPKED
jgi:hypothetical protein